ncbi:MAG: nitroreductase family protein [bacterium]|nr:nitroreductase family protein [bacterium]
MEIKKVIQERYSCRSYKDTPVSEEKLKSILKAAQFAPSASNRQPYKFVIIRDRGKREKLAEAAGQSFIATAAIIIAGVSLEPERIMSCEVPTYAVDLAIAMEHIALQACAEGLGTCWIGAFSQQEAKKILGVPEEYKIVALMPIGYSTDSQGLKERKNLEELVCYEKFD